MRYLAPARHLVDPAVFAQPPLAQWSEFHALLHGTDWPDAAALRACRDKVANATNATLPHFTEQTAELLRDGLHYESRIAQCGQVATRAQNWHDLLNVLVWLRYPKLKAALNVRQVEEIARIGVKRRTRAQYALTHFDEAGVIVWLREAALLALWDAHDWHGLFWRERAAWRDGGIRVEVFGHALLEHALTPSQLLVGKAVVVLAASRSGDELAARIRDASLLNDPLELRPLPLSGIPGWHAQTGDESFYGRAPCFRPRREGRHYPPPVRLD